MVETKKILVTGGLGFIGSNLSLALAKEGHEVTILDKAKNWRNIEGHEDSFAIINKNILDKEAVALAVNDKDAIVHLAANVSHIQGQKDPYLDMESNIRGTINMADAVKDFKNKPRIIYACSRSAYGMTQTMPVKETHRVQPLDAYGISKLAGEKYLMMYSHHYDIPVLSFRKANVVGERQGLNTRAYQMISWIWRQVKLGKPIGFWGDGKQSRDFLYVQDAVKFYKNAATNDKLWDEKPMADFYNLPGGEYDTWMGAIETAGEALHMPTEVNLEPYPNKMRVKLENPHSCLDGTKLKERFGEVPETKLDTAFTNMDKFYNEDNIEDYLKRGIN